MSDLESRLEALRRDYAARLPAQVGEARAAMATLPKAGQVEAVWQVVHRIHGTAGSYGLDAVAGVARSLEALLTPHRTKDALPADVAESAMKGLEELTAQALDAART